PMIGFLGTVVGITLAIANVTPDQLDTSLNQVTGGLAVAFDTTAVAISFTVVLVFSYVWVKHLEQQLLSKVECISDRQLAPLLSVTEHAADPVHQAQTVAARQLLDRTESLVREQTILWRESMDGMRSRWSETIDSQQQELSHNLHQGVESTLTEHADQLAHVRNEFLTAFESAAGQFQAAIETDAARRDERESRAEAQQQALWERIQAGLQDVLRVHDARTEDLLDGFSERMHQWQDAMERSSQSVEAQVQSLADCAGQLSRLLEQGEHLTRVERQLVDNLAAVRAAETFEETLHNLTAAVHLLTARAKPRAA
ncbi:MAG: MotA/TolQ/ExbB proton channel family protein, partial [Planctomycetaceae bacterium]|nr:MotA/TolQ/ExbB proton channel family protein [Planctomycetaceae bacterium]